MPQSPAWIPEQVIEDAPRKQLELSVPQCEPGDWKHEFKKSSFTTTILNLLFTEARNFRMYIGLGSDGSSADKLSLDLKFNPWDTAITFRSEWRSMSKTVLTQYDPFETGYTCQSIVWLDDLKRFYPRSMRCVIRKFSRFDAMLYICEDNEAVIKMIIKGRSSTMRHVSRTHRVALHWLFDRINLDPKIQIKYIDTKNQLADTLTKGNFTRDEWNHLLTLFNISHFSSTACTAAMAKRSQQGSGEQRVTAKARPMMNLTARMPSVVSSSASSNPRRTSYGYQDPGKSVAVDDRSGKPERPSPPGYSKEDCGQSWSSQEWKSGAAAHDRSGKPEKTSWDMMQQVAPSREEPLLDGNALSVRYGEMIHDGSGKPEKLNHQEEADSETFVMGSDAAEFVNKVKDQVRSRQKRMSKVAEAGEEHSIIWGMFMAATTGLIWIPRFKSNTLTPKTNSQTY